MEWILGCFREKWGLRGEVFEFGFCSEAGPGWVCGISLEKRIRRNVIRTPKRTDDRNPHY